MIRRCAFVIAAMASFSWNGAIGQVPAAASLQGNDANEASLNAEQGIAAAKIAELRQPAPGGNPLWGVPISSLSATRERPIFSASRRPPAPPAPPPPVAEAPPPPPAAPERPPFTLVGTAVGKPQNVALLLDETSRNLVRLHVGEAASGWYLRSVDLRTMTLEKNNQTVVLALPAPSASPAGPSAPAPLAVASGVTREF